MPCNQEHTSTYFLRTLAHKEVEEKSITKFPFHKHETSQFNKQKVKYLKHFGYTTIKEVSLYGTFIVTTNIDGQVLSFFFQ